MSTICGKENVITNIGLESFSLIVIFQTLRSDAFSPPSTFLSPAY